MKKKSRTAAAARTDRKSARRRARRAKSTHALKMQFEGDDGRAWSFRTTQEKNVIPRMKYLAKKHARGSGLGDFSGEQISFNHREKRCLLDDLTPEAAYVYSRALTAVLPSKTSPEPSNTTTIDGTDPNGEGRNTERFFKTAYQASNFIINGDARFAWAKSAKRPQFHHNAMRGSEEEKNIPHLADDAVKVEDYNCSNLVSKEECKKIFGGRTADQLSYDIACVVDHWIDETDYRINPEDSLRGMIGNEVLPKEVQGSGGHYAAAISAGFSRFKVKWHAKRPACAFANNFLLYLEMMILKQGNLETEQQALDFLLSNADLFDDFLWNEDALEMLQLRKENGIHHNGDLEGNGLYVPSGNELDRMKETQKMVLTFTNLIDRRWQEKYENQGKSALRERFGHPVGIPSQAVKEHHFLPGGYLVESGWLQVSPGSADKYEINFPVDKNGKPRPDTKEWEEVSPRATVDKNATKLKQLSTLSQFCVRAAEAWHISYNKGLPRDNLYTAAQISVIDPAKNGNSYDDATGTVRGAHIPQLRGIEFAVGKNMRLFPTLRGKISAITRRLADERTCPSGMLSLEEIDLSNWRLARFSDNQCGNEYGHSQMKDGAPALHAFDKLDRKFHEKIQKKVRALDESDGLFTFYQPDHDFVRPLAGVQRAEAMGLYIERPGTYLRRSASGGTSLGLGCPDSVFQQVSQPMAPWSVFLDAATGEYTDGSNVAWCPPGRSLNPYHFCAKGSGIYRIGKYLSSDDFSKTFPKFMSVASMRRGENFPRRIRFAMRSLGETASRNGLVYPEADLEKVFRESDNNVHSHVDDRAIFTDEKLTLSEQLSGVHWNDEDLFIRDFELGEMGTLYRQALDSEDDRRVLLQQLLNGKQTFRDMITDGGRRLLQLSQYGYRFPADPRTAFGDLAITGQSWNKDQTDHLVHARQQGVRTNTQLWNWNYVTFHTLRLLDGFDIPIGADAPGAKYVCNTVIYAGRCGYTITGLEDTPLTLDGSPPIKQGTRLTEWGELVFNKAWEDEYEMPEMEGVRKIKAFQRDFLYDMEKRSENMRKRGEDPDGEDPDSKYIHARVGAQIMNKTGAFTTHTHGLVMQVQDIYFDEFMGRGVRDGGKVRPKLKKFHLKHIEAHPPRRDGYTKLLEDILEAVVKIQKEGRWIES